MPLEHNQIACREDGRVLLRPQPLRLKWSFDDLVSADGHILRALFTCSARALPEPAERRMLEEVFLAATDVLSADAVVAHFHSPLRNAAAACKDKPAAQWLADGARDTLVEAMRTAGNAVAFSCGLELLAPFTLELQSPTLERQQTEAMQRALAEQRAAGQVQHLQRASDLLRRFDEIRQSAPQLSSGEVLRQISPADQGELLQTLLLASGSRKATRAVWAVAGPNLLRIDPATSPPHTEILPLPATLGPLRSVQPAGESMLLVGARSGVLQMHRDAPSAAVAYSDPAVVSQLGFSRAVLWNGEIWACHSEAGIVAWKLSEPDRPVLALRPVDLAGAAPRNLQVLDDARLIFSTRDRLMLLTRRPQEAPAVSVSAIQPDLRVEVMAVLPDDRRLAVVLKDGTVQVRDAASLEVLSQGKRSGEVASAALMPWLGGTRLLLATEDGPVLSVGLDDDLVTQYLSPYRGLKAVAAAADVIIGLSGDRQRLLLWHTWDARKPLADLFVTSIARHRAADVDV